MTTGRLIRSQKNASRIAKDINPKLLLAPLAKAASMRAIAAWFCLIAAALAFLAYQSAGARFWMLNKRLDSTANADYVPFVERLLSDGRYEEASRIAFFIVSRPDMPRQERIAALREEIDERRADRGPMRFGAALLGNLFPPGLEDVAEVVTMGEVLSEGRVKKRTAAAADKLARDLAGAHLGIADAWFPHAIRLLRRGGRISPEYEHFLLKNASESANRGEATPELRSAVEGTRTLVRVMGVSRTLDVYGKVGSDADIEQLGVWSYLSPDTVYIVTMHGGIDLLSAIPDDESGRALMTKIAEKGARGVRIARFWLK